MSCIAPVSISQVTVLPPSWHVTAYDQQIIHNLLNKQIKKSDIVNPRLNQVLLATVTGTQRLFDEFVDHSSCMKPYPTEISALPELASKFPTSAATCTKAGPESLDLSSETIKTVLNYSTEELNSISITGPIYCDNESNKPSIDSNYYSIKVYSICFVIPIDLLVYIMIAVYTL